MPAYRIWVRRLVIDRPADAARIARLIEADLAQRLKVPGLPSSLVADYEGEVATGVSARIVDRLRRGGGGSSG